MSEQDQQEVKTAVQNFNNAPDVNQGGKKEEILGSLYQDVNVLRDNQNSNADLRSINDQIDMRRAGFQNDVLVVGLGNAGQLIISSPEGKPNEFAVVNTKGEVLKTGTQQDITQFLGIDRAQPGRDPYNNSGSPEDGRRNPYDYSGSPEDAAVNHKKSEKFNRTVVETDEQGNQSIVVQKGNCLWYIAEDILNARGMPVSEGAKAKLAREIYNLNKEVIGNNWDVIKEGQTFKMPPSVAEKFENPPPTQPVQPPVRPQTRTGNEGEAVVPPVEPINPPVNPDRQQRTVEKKPATLKGDSSETRPRDDRYSPDTPPGMDAQPDEVFDGERNTDGGFDHEHRKLNGQPTRDPETGEMVYKYSGEIDTGTGSGDTPWTGEQRLDDKGNVTFRSVEYDPKFKDELKFNGPDGKEIKLKNVKRVVTALNEETGKYVTQIQLENGRLYEAVTDGHGKTESFEPKPWIERDSQNRVTRVVDAGGREYKFEYEGNTTNLSRVQNAEGGDFHKVDGKWLNFKNGKKQYDGELRVDQTTGEYSFTDTKTRHTTHRQLDGSTLVVDENTQKPVSMTPRGGPTFSYTWNGEVIQKVSRSDGGTFTRGADGRHFDGSSQKNLTIEVDPKTGVYSYASDKEAAIYYTDGRVTLTKK